MGGDRRRISPVDPTTGRLGVVNRPGREDAQCRAPMTGEAEEVQYKPYLAARRSGYIYRLTPRSAVRLQGRGNSRLRPADQQRILYVLSPPLALVRGDEDKALKQRP